MNQGLTNPEVVLLRSWLWERAKGIKDGPAHKMVKEHGMKLENGVDAILACLYAEIEVYLARRLIDLTIGPRPQIPQEWPWPKIPVDNVERWLRERVGQREVLEAPFITSPARSLFFAVGLTGLLIWLGAGIILSMTGALVLILTYYWLKGTVQKKMCQPSQSFANPDQEVTKTKPPEILSHRVLNYRGWEWETCDPGERESYHCQVCRETMEVIRNRKGDRSGLGAIHGSGTYSDHDFFYCQHSNEAWHEQAIRLKDEMGKSRSATIKKLLQEEIDQILRTRTPTIKPRT